MKQIISQEQALQELKKGYSKAEKVLKEKGKVDALLERLEQKLKTVPNVGEKLSHVPVFIQLVKCYIKKEYTLIPITSVVAIVSALIYVLSPIDIIPDWFPGGHLDDVVVVAACLKLVDEDVKEFLQWRDEHKNINEVVVL